MGLIWGARGGAGDTGLLDLILGKNAGMSCRAGDPSVPCRVSAWPVLSKHSYLGVPVLASRFHPGLLDLLLGGHQDESVPVPQAPFLGAFLPGPAHFHTPQAAQFQKPLAAWGRPGPPGLLKLQPPT